MLLGGGELIQDMQEIAAPAASWWASAWAFTRETLELLPLWARAVLVVFVIVSVVVGKILLPSVANYVQATRAKLTASTIRKPK